MEEVLLAARSFDLMAFKHRDAGAAFSKWMTDEEIMKMCPWQAHKTVEDTHEFVKREEERQKEGNYTAWGLFFDDFSYGQNRPRLFGYATLQYDEESSTATAFVVISKDEQRKGYGMEALSVVARYAFSTLHANCVTAAIPHFNVAGRKLLERAGFVSQYQFPATWRGEPGVPMLRYTYSRAQYEAE